MLALQLLGHCCRVNVTLTVHKCYCCYLYMFKYLGSLDVSVAVVELWLSLCKCHHVSTVVVYVFVIVCQSWHDVLVGNCFKFQSIKNSNKVNSVQ